jgi:hypothetical protein
MENMMQKRFGTAALTAALGLGAAHVSAAPFLTAGIQELEDQDFESLYQLIDGVAVPGEITESTVLQAGDIFAGVLKIQQTRIAATPTDPPGPAIDLQGPDTFTAIFAIEAETVTAITGDVNVRDSGTDELTFKPTPQSTWDAVFGAGGPIDITTEFDVGDLDGLGTDLADGTMVLLFDQVDFFGADEGLADTSLSGTSFVEDGRLLYEFGFTGAGGAALADEFWVTRGEDAALPFYVGATTPSNRIALNVTEKWAGPKLEAHNWRLTVAGDPTFTGDTQFQGFGNVTGLGGGIPWAITTDTDIYIKALPEPASLALMAAGIVGIGFASKRRRSN